MIVLMGCIAVLCVLIGALIWSAYSSRLAIMWYVIGLMNAAICVYYALQLTCN